MHRRVKKGQSNIGGETIVVSANAVPPLWAGGFDRAGAWPTCGLRDARPRQRGVRVSIRVRGQGVQRLHHVRRRGPVQPHQQQQNGTQECGGLLDFVRSTTRTTLGGVLAPQRSQTNLATLQLSQFRLCSLCLLCLFIRPQLNLKLPRSSFSAFRCMMLFHFCFVLQVCGTACGAARRRTSTRTASGARARAVAAPSRPHPRSPQAPSSRSADTPSPSPHAPSSKCKSAH